MKMEAPPGLKYSKEHEWVSTEESVATVGITDHAQTQLGDIVFVELPQPGRDVAAGEACAVVESVKAASDVFAPLAGHVTEVNAALADNPALANRDAEGEGWFFRLTLSDPAAFATLLDADAYGKLVETA